MNIDELYQDFNLCVKESQDCLTDMLNTISAGKVPSRKDVSQFDLVLANLRAKYDCVYQAAVDLLPADEMPEDNSPADVYVESIKNNEAVRVKQIFDTAKDCLQRFVSVRSLVNAYTSALIPFQKEALNILESLEKSSETDLETIAKSIEKPKILLAAIECNDKDSDEGIVLCDRVAEYYPSRIYSGVVANKYFINKDAVISEILQDDNSPKKIIPDNSKEASVSAGDSLQESFSKTENEISSADTSGSISPFVKRLHTENCFIESDDEIGNIDHTNNPNENKKISASIFTNEIRHDNISCKLSIIESLSFFGTVSKELLEKTTKHSKEVIQSCLNYLMNKGYLSKYSIDQDREFYRETTRLKKALNYKEACKTFDLKHIKPDSWEPSIDDLPTAIAAKMAISKLNVLTISRMKSRGISIGIRSGSISTNSFLIRFSANKSLDESDVVAGTFWNSDSECDEYLEQMKSFLSDCGEIMSFTFAAWDLRRAKTILDIIFASVEDLQLKCPIYLYVLSENASYSYPDALPIDDNMYEPQNSIEENTVQNSPLSEESDSKANALKEPIDNDLSDNAIAENEEVELVEKDDDLKITHITVSEEADEINHDDENKFISHISEEASVIHKLVNSSTTPSDDELYDLICQILEGNAGTSFNENSSIAQALLLTKAASFAKSNTKCAALDRQLAYATRSPLSDLAYIGENLSNAFASPISSAIHLSAYLFAMLIPNLAYDYSLKVQINEYFQNYDIYFPELTELKTLYDKLRTIRDVLPTGFTPSILSFLGSNSGNEEFLKSLVTQANNLLLVPKARNNIRDLPIFYNSCFGRSSDLYHCLEIVMNNDTDNVDVVEILLDEVCEKNNGVLTLNSRKIEEYLDKLWFDVNKQGSSFSLEYAARKKTINQINTRLNVIKTWHDHVKILHNGKYDFVRLNTLKKEIIDLIDQGLFDISEKEFKHKTVILWALKSIKNYLNGPIVSDNTLFIEIAQTGVISLNDDNKPILMEEMDSVKYYEPWRTVLRHILSPVNSLESAKNEILNGGLESDLFDNLHQLEIIGDLTGESMVSSPQQIDAARKSALDVSKDFDDALELAYTYYRITEIEKENLAAIKKQHEETLLDRKDYGIWRQFLKALYQWIDELTNIKKNELQSRLDFCFKTDTGKKSPILQSAQVLLDKDRNFAVAEEYINRFDNGEEDFSAELQSVLQEVDHFSEFISDKVYNPIYQECFRKKDSNFHNIAKEYLSKHFPADWTSRLKDDSLRFVTGTEKGKEKFWPIRKGQTTSHQITDLFNWLGLTVNHTDKYNYKSEEMFKIEVVPSPRSMADYRHPISAFGTQSKKQMDVIILHGNIPAKQLVDKIAGFGLGGMPIVILNYPINMAVRRQIAEEFHKTSGQNPFILIDQVLVIYLALHQITERLPIMLKCTLPFTTYQPFVRDGGSTADEMFFGRIKELNTIMDPNGACVVYGGRQLGKTALLERAESLCFKPENRSFAVYCNILNCTDEKSMVQRIVEDVHKKTTFEISSCSTIKQLSDSFDMLFRSKKVDRFLLLLDETDRFLSAIADQRYEQLQPLIDLKRSTKNKFKFVLAGLHNVCRAKNATDLNGVFGQLGSPLCVEPLSPTDALQLLSRPLKYLGFQIDRYPHLETILTNTNYYPGILQFFGYMLVETLSTHYGKYYRAVDGNPPYTLQDEQLGAVMNSADLNRSIKDKFRWSLELDPRYFMIARCIAVLYYMSDMETNTWLGFSIEQIKDIADSYDILCLKHESEHDYDNLLDEMVKMGILSRPDQKKKLFRLRRSSFISIIGSDFETVDEDIIKHNTEA